VVAVPSHTTFGKRASGTYQIRGWVGPRRGRMLRNRENLLLRLGIVLPSHYTNYIIPAMNSAVV